MPDAPPATPPTPVPSPPSGLHIPTPSWLTWNHVLTTVLAVLAAWDHVLAPLAAEWSVRVQLPIVAVRRHPTPHPAPAPIPAPPPAPTPAVSGHLYAVYIADVNNPTLAQASFKANPAIVGLEASLDFDFEWYESNHSSLGPDRRNLLAYAGGGYPCVVFQAKDGTVLKAHTLRAPTVDQLVAKLKELRGAK